VRGRLGCSQRLQDQGGITPVDCDPSRPLILPRVHSGERGEAFFQPFCSKSFYVLAVCWCLRSPRLQPATTGSSRHLSRRLWSISAADPAQSALKREKRGFLPALLLQKLVCSGGLLVRCRLGCSQRLQDQVGITPIDCDPSRPLILPRVHSGERGEAFFQPFYSKSFCVLAVCWCLRSPRLQPATTGSSRHLSRRL
jgi:hypothetical protein